MICVACGSLNSRKTQPHIHAVTIANAFWCVTFLVLERQECFFSTERFAIVPFFSGEQKLLSTGYEIRSCEKFREWFCMQMYTVLRDRRRANIFASGEESEWCEWHMSISRHIPTCQNRRYNLRAKTNVCKT